MHKNTKLAPALRKQIFQVWKKEKCSQRELGLRYHVDKKVIARIIERGMKGDFSIHDSTNIRYIKKKRSVKKPSTNVSKSKTRVSGSRTVGGKKTVRKRITRG